MADFDATRRKLLHAAGGGLMSRVLTRDSARELPNETWLADLNGKHRQFLDVGDLAAGKPLKRTHNFLTSYADGYHIPESALSVLFGAHSSGLGFVCGDVLWTRFGLGAMYGIIDPATGKPVQRNPFLSDDRPLSTFGLTAESSVAGLQARGVRFLACSNSISALSRQLAAKGLGAEDEIRLTIEHGLVKDSMIVPGMLVAANRAQEEGFQYAFIS